MALRAPGGRWPVRAVIGGLLWLLGSAVLIAGVSLIYALPFLEFIEIAMFRQLRWLTALEYTPWVALALVGFGALIAARGGVGVGLWCAGLAGVALIGLAEVTLGGSWWGWGWPGSLFTPTTGSLTAVLLWFCARRISPRAWALMTIPLAVWLVHVVGSRQDWELLRPQSLEHELVIELVPLVAALLAVVIAEAITAKVQPALDAARAARREASLLAFQEQSHAQRVAAVQQWQDAWRAANPGQDAPDQPPSAFAAGPGGYPGAFPGAYNAGPAPGSTNGMAIASLITGIPGMSVPAVILGHIGLSQVRRTGERGRGMALAGTILGYAWFVIGIAASVWYFVLMNNLSSY